MKLSANLQVLLVSNQSVFSQRCVCWTKTVSPRLEIYELEFRKRVFNDARNEKKKNSEKKKKKEKDEEEEGDQQESESDRERGSTEEREYSQKREEVAAESEHQRDKTEECEKRMHDIPHQETQEKHIAEAETAKLCGKTGQGSRNTTQEVDKGSESGLFELFTFRFVFWFAFCSGSRNKAGIFVTIVAVLAYHYENRHRISMLSAFQLLHKAAIHCRIHISKHTSHMYVRPTSDRSDNTLYGIISRR